ncbi:MAG: M23 family metallopeptidase [Candidatus Acidiferrum sp.]|jgi:murein DD-endopeptidase MepM/ murein hydrolase activator NlpD
MTSRRAIAALLAGLLTALAESPWTVAAPQRAAHQRAAESLTAVPRTACGAGATLSLSGTSASQGGLLLATLSLKSPLTSVHAKWDTQEISFWQNAQAASATAKPQIWHAFVPVDLEKAPGDYAFAVDLQPPQTPASPANCQLTIHVTPGNFATESLKVAPQFVEPDPEQLARAKKEGQRLREIYATITPDKLWQGRFRVPLTGRTSGANFGRRRVLNGEPSSPHTGVDFPAPTGTPVHAAQAGRVVLAEPLYFGGNSVLIDHGWGVYTLYCHLSVISVKVGDALSVDAILGKVGATGRVTGPHLHWGLDIAGARVNALQILKFSGF